MSQKFFFNRDWLFTDSFSEALIGAQCDDTLLTRVELPHTVKVTDFNYFDEKEYQMTAGYRKVFDVPADWKGKSVRLTFEGVAHKSDLFVNGKSVFTHNCGYTAFTADLTDELKYGESNVIALRVDSNESLNQPPFGFVIDYMTYGGIYREAYFEISEKKHIEDAFFYSDIDLKAGTAVLSSKVTLSGDCKGTLTGLELRLLVNDRELGKKTADGTETILSFDAGAVNLWSVEDPVLYDVKAELIEKETGSLLDSKCIRFGFRKSEFKKDGYYLNGRKLKIRGLNRHQSYPYVGYAMPESIQKNDADILKYELGLNAVRTSHYPQSHHFLDRCDEIGLLVFTEIPGWQHIGDEEWKGRAVLNVRDMVRQYRNHTSIILWGVRINESRDDDAFYKDTNEAARSLDPTRPTGGVRALKKSSFLEDVYTYNDFVHEGSNKGCEPKKNVATDPAKPYLISEYNGHMYPTKTFDDEEQRREHAIRHANVLNSVAGERDIAGSFGWCMCDYNTHKDFGSGDRICYHGVLDMFRNPKQAAFVYSSLQEKEPVLYLSSSMDIGEHPACNRGITWIYTNADSVRMYKNDRFIKEYKPADSPYKNLAHGPIMVDDFIGNAVEEGETGPEGYKKALKEALNIVAVYGMSHPPKRFYALVLKLVLFHHMNPSVAVPLYNKYVGDWGGAATEYKFEAIKNGQVVKTLIKKPFSKLKLELIPDHTGLKAGATYDVAAVRVRATDEAGNVAHFFNEPVTFKTEGNIEIIGEETVGFKGGLCGVYVRTKKGTGTGILTVSNRQTGTQTVEFSVVKDTVKEI